MKRIVSKDQQSELKFLVLNFFKEGARGTNFHKGEEFDKFNYEDIRAMLYSLVNVGFIQRLDFKTTNGAGYVTTPKGIDHMHEIEQEFEGLLA